MSSVAAVRLRSALISSRSRLPHNAAAVRDRYLSSNLPSSSSSSLPTTQDQNALSTPINFDTSALISGEESQILEVKLKPNQKLRAESGAMLYMTHGVEMSTSLGGKEGSYGISNAMSRMLTGQNMFLSDYTYEGQDDTSGVVALGTNFPSKIMRFSLSQYGNKIICQKGAYLASSMDVNIEMEFAKKFTAGFFGGEGFVLQKLEGEGDVFVKAGGTLVKKDLKEGETLRLSSGSLVAFTQDVEYDVQTMKGFKNVMFGGEGLFVTTLTGPGTVWLQGMPPDRMISEVARRVPSGGGIGLGVPIGMGGGGGGEGADGGAEGVEGGDEDALSAVDAGGEESVMASDAEVDADRNATVASSGFGDSGVDSESSNALFGDASPEGESSSTSGMNEPNFGDDLTNDQQFDDFQQDETSFSTEGGSDGASGGDEEGGGLFSTLFDFLSDSDD